MGDLPLADMVAFSVMRAQITMAQIDMVVFFVLFTG